MSDNFRVVLLPELCAANVVCMGVAKDNVAHRGAGLLPQQTQLLRCLDGYACVKQYIAVTGDNHVGVGNTRCLIDTIGQLLYLDRDLMEAARGVIGHGAHGDIAHNLHRLQGRCLLQFCSPEQQVRSDTYNY